MSFIIQYADDTQYLESGSIDNLLEIIRSEQTLLKIKQYFNNNGLLLNSKKTECILIGSRALTSKVPSDLVIKVGVSISPNLSLKNLGVFFDRHMSFDNHISEMSKKVSGILMYINRIQDSLSKEAKLIAGQPLVLSHLNYAISVWGTVNITHLKRVQKLQNFAARVATGGV